MPMIPWMQQVSGARFGEPPDKPPIDLAGLQEKYPQLGPATLKLIAEGKAEPPAPVEKADRWKSLAPWTKEFIWPWEWDQPEFQALPGWAQTASKVGLGAAGVAGGAALGGWGIPAAAGAISGAVPGLTAAALPFVAHPTLMGLAGAGAGWLGSQAMAPGGAPPGVPSGAPGAPGLEPTEPTPGAPVVGQTRVNYSPTGVPFIEEWNGTDWERTVEEMAAGPETQPQVITVGDQQFWWDPTGGMYGTGGWSLIPAKAPTLTPEQQIGLSEEERAHQMAMLQEQYRLEQQTMSQQGGQARGMQEAAAAQQMAQMYAADPYKYWAQMGQGTPGAVARLTGGQVAPGQQMQQGVPLSTPSAQWWQNLLPSEQQQISGGLNWMGVDPADWYSMYQRMIPGLGQRQMEPVWAR